MNMYEGKPLKPLDSGIVLLVGVKSSNFDDELKTHPRIVMWDSQNEHWTSKDLPSNTRAVFLTRFISHSAFDNIVTQARKRQITIFNPTGTGIIAKQVKELLNIHPVVEDIPGEIAPEVEVEETMNKGKKLGKKDKLQPLVPMINYDRTNIQNARDMFKRAKELGIQTTEGSLSQFVLKMRKRNTLTFKPAVKHETKDVAVEIFDGIIKQFQEIRKYLVETTNENAVLKAKLENLKKALG